MSSALVGPVLIEADADQAAQGALTATQVPAAAQASVDADVVTATST